MIIGISGKKQSGKDTIGKMIQYLTTTKTSFEIKDFDDYISKEYKINPSWKVHKFADKVKDIVCLLIGCTREQLEDETFKNTELGEEWTKKHTNFITKETFEKQAKFNNQTLEEYYNEYKDDYEILDNGAFYRAKYLDIGLTPRKLLQLIGTNCGRNIIHPNIWVNATMAKYNHYNCIDEINDTVLEESNWIITDVRFPNEVKAIEDKGGIVIRVNRYPYNLKKGDVVKYIHSDKPEIIETIEHQVLDKVANPAERCKINGEYVYYSDIILTNEHPSETALDNHKFQYTINNNGSIDDLLHQIGNLLTIIKVI